MVLNVCIFYIQAPPIGAKGSGPSVLENRGVYASAKQDSPKFSSGEYIPASSHAQLYGEKGPDYPTIDRRQYGRQSAYMGRDLQSDPTGRFADSVGFGPQHQVYNFIFYSSILIYSSFTFSLLFYLHHLL